MNMLHQDYEGKSDANILRIENEQLKDRITELERVLQTCEAELADAKEKIRKLQCCLDNSEGSVFNARGAGRKKDNVETQQKRETFIVLQNSGADMLAIMDRMAISRSTYYRLKRYAELMLKKEGADEQMG